MASPELKIGGRGQPSWIIKPDAKRLARAAAPPTSTPTASAKPVSTSVAPAAKTKSAGGVVHNGPPDWLLGHPLDLAAFGRQLHLALCRPGSIDCAAWLAIAEDLPTDLQSGLWANVLMRLNKHSSAALQRPGNHAIRERVEATITARPSGHLMPYATRKQQFDVFAAIFWRYASQNARIYFKAGIVSLLSLRNESSTLAHNGEGSYDDILVVMRKIGRSGMFTIFPICTEPGAQYSQRASNGKDKRYRKVDFNKIEGEDINKDGIKDAGRLIESTYHYYEKPGGHLKARAFWVLPKGHKGPALSSFRQVVERDTNGDGRFTQDDDSRIDRIGAGISMFIHRGGTEIDKKNPDTYSAGCQTIPYNRYDAFLKTVGHPESFFYVLVNAAP